MSQASAEDAPPRTPEKSVKGMTWVEARRVWVVRYKIAEGEKKQKRFAAAGDGDEDAAKEDARASALSWIAEGEFALW